jgi:RimJ/RimL family protein N-acetyltransferase
MVTGYKILRENLITDGVILLRAVEPSDIERIRQWRNSQMDVLRQGKPISKYEQDRYFSEYVWPEKNSLTPRQIILSIDLGGELIGYGGLVNISWFDRRAEVSFLLSTELEKKAGKRAELFERFLSLLKNLSRDTLLLHRIWTETYAHRIAHIETLEKSMFKLEGLLKDHVFINQRFIDSMIHGIILKK